MLRQHPSRQWLYEGRTKHGDWLSGSIEAPTAIIARVKLRKREIIPLAVRPRSGWSFFSYGLAKRRGKVASTEKSLSGLAKLSRSREIHELTKKESLGSEKRTQRKVKRPVKAKEITVFVKQFVVVIKSGVPLLKAFDIVIRGIDNRKFLTILEDIKFGVENGLSLSAAFGTYSGVFDLLFINFLAIGEQGGILETLLLRYVEYREQVDAVRRKVKAALVYPLIVLSVSTLVLGIVLGFVVPQFQKIFASVGAQLPLPTQIVIAASDLIIHYWWLLIGIITLIIFMLRLGYRHLPRFRFFSDSFILRVPLAGDLVQKSLISRWTRTLSLLFAAGVPLNEALHSIAVLVNNYRYGAATLSIQKDVESGSSLYTAMLATDIFPSMVNQMVAVGEEAGSLEYLLHSVADYYDQEVEMIIETLLALLEPATIVILGGVLGSIIVAIYLPLFNLGNVVG